MAFGRACLPTVGQREYRGAGGDTERNDGVCSFYEEKRRRDGENGQEEEGGCGKKEEKKDKHGWSRLLIGQEKRR